MNGQQNQLKTSIQNATSFLYMLHNKTIYDNNVHLPIHRATTVSPSTLEACTVHHTSSYRYSCLKIGLNPMPHPNSKN